MPFVVVYDASVLHPSTLRDLLIRIAQAALVADGWTNPPGSVNDVLDRLERDGLVESAALLRR